ncbi:Pho2p [Sugiyamaella lignohabitans]|uniref:Pho2p n=1 Tax=Sugiyamaella lignohabitans TaxID=796027 RepID=A0A167F360_9ASCO|nr:Pho2p [Sugiyamaella lignohabitans]ANB14765.1 Pho2p [Sugiyamaella lignohabitans]
MSESALVSPSTHSMSSSSGTNTRTRKSTLTQQQKNKKRQRATPAQLVYLKKEFEINNTPNAKTREEIGKKIDMTERSVQIWFQNKRAKQKLFSRKHNISGLGNISPLGPNMVGNRYFSPSSNSSLDNSSYSSPGLGGMAHPKMFVMPYDGMRSFARSASSLEHRQALRGYGNLASLIVFSCRSLTIGSWRRVASPNATNGLTPDDLTVLYSPSESTFTYLMFDGTTRFRMEFPAKSVEKITLSVDENNSMAGVVTLCLNNRPSFSVKTPKSPDRWLVCGDFSVAEQASRCTIHKLVGPYNQLHGQVCQLYSFQPSKVSAGLLTPPQTATSTSSERELEAVSQRSRLVDNLWLNAPERSQTRSTPAVFTCSNNVAVHDVCDSILAFGDSVSENDLTSPAPGGSELADEIKDDIHDALFSEPEVSQISWNTIFGDEESQFAPADDLFEVKIGDNNAAHIDTLFSTQSSLGMISPDSDGAGKMAEVISGQVHNEQTVEPAVITSPTSTAVNGDTVGTNAPIMSSSMNGSGSTDFDDQLLLGAGNNYTLDATSSVIGLNDDFQLSYVVNFL